VVVTRTHVSLRTAIDEVASRDPVLAQLVERVGYVKHRPRDPDGPFAALVRSIVFQQLAGRAAQAIYGRVRAAVGESLTPESLSAASDAALRGAGLSGNKLAALRDLSAKVLDGTVVLTRSSRRSDEELIARLTTVRGIGRWTAEMYLMFQLRRLDIWPIDDLGSARVTALPGSSNHRRSPRSSSPSVTAFAPTGPSWPATAGRPFRFSSRAVPRQHFGSRGAYVKIVLICRASSPTSSPTPRGGRTRSSSWFPTSTQSCPSSRATGDLSLAIVLPAAAVGAFLGDNTAYLIGRRYGVRIQERFFRSEKARKRIGWAEKQLDERGGELIAIGRFIPGGRTAVTLSAGTLRFPWRRFAVFDAASAIGWATYASLLGYLGGSAFEKSTWKALVLALGIAFAVAAGIELTRWLLKRRAAT
jgi:DNA-3-methyladenine glycosylase II